MAIIVFLLCAGVGYLAETYLPNGEASPYIGLFLAYHLFLTYLIVRAVAKSEQKLRISMPWPVAAIAHLAVVGALVGVVMGQEYVPLLALLKYIVPGLAPFEVKWVLEGYKNREATPESASMPAGTHEEYSEFLNYLKQSNRKFQRAGRSVHEEFSFWLKDRNKRLGETTKPLTRQG